MQTLHAEEAAIARAAELLRAGEVVAYPTETRYGLAVRFDDGDAIARLVAVKGRGDQPLSVLVSNHEMLERVVDPSAISRRARELMTRHWPGPLTLVLPGRNTLHRALRNAEGGVGVRISPDPVAAALVDAAGLPLTATSANLSSEPAASSAEEAALAGVALILDDGPRDGQPSTVAVVSGEAVKVLRAGGVAL
ncbi:MAG: threonylcarbamoyl-AMP synthase [Deltaproteobacteria bacterium]|nr:MAG: threonylcarbamoyl-AMP synthase [Pseudomonadota bacterium]PIE66343.1 MAG: threonylcarbamoyl-AMP synthase [Deltaproteobacteria bacterium]